MTIEELSSSVSQDFEDFCPDEQHDTDTQPLLKKRKSKCCGWSVRNYFQEFTVFFYMFAFSLTINCTTNLNMERACSLVFNRTENECNGNDTHLNDEVQKLANKFNLYIILVRLLPSGILGIFVGPWSDKYGRKPFIYFALTGIMITSGGMIWYAVSNRAPPYFSVITTIPEGISGSIIIVLSSMYTLASESTNVESRTFKYATLQISILFASPLGTLTAGLIYEGFQYVPVYCLGFGSYLVSLMFFFFIKDETERNESTLKAKFKDFFDCVSIKENVQVIMKKRDNKGTLQIILAILSAGVLLLNYVAVDQILYLFSKKMFSWTLTYYSNVSTVSRIGEGISTIVCVSLLRKVWKIPDAWMGLLGAFSLFAQALLRGFSFYPWIYFTATIIGLIGSLAMISIRSRLSKKIDKNDLGKVFSVLAIVESFVPVAGSLMITLVYNASVGFFPGLALVVAAGLLLFPIIVFMWIIRHDVKTRENLTEYNSQESETDVIHSEIRSILA